MTRPLAEVLADLEANASALARAEMLFEATRRDVEAAYIVQDRTAESYWAAERAVAELRIARDQLTTEYEAAKVAYRPAEAAA